MKYYLIAGEASGDLHGGKLMKGLLDADPQAQFRFWGGESMEAAGGSKAGDYRDTAVMGVGDVLAALGKISRKLRECKADILRWKPDVVIPIDYPGFNLRMARFSHERGIKVFYYIAPKTWASRDGRNHKLKAFVDRLFIIFPFEKDYFLSRGIPAVYKGNPLVDAVDSHSYSRPAEGRYIAILPGSRKGEISHTMPAAMKMADAIHALPRHSDCQFLIAGAPGRSEADYEAYTQGRPYVKLLFSRTYDILKYADAALVNSGTASLEAALIGTPQVVCWSTQPLTAFLMNAIGRPFSHIKYISLGNLILDKCAFRELIQNDFTPEAATSEILRLMEDLPYRRQMLSDYSEIRARLGESGASQAIARAMVVALRAED